MSIPPRQVVRLATPDRGIEDNGIESRDSATVTAPRAFSAPSSGEASPTVTCTVIVSPRYQVRTARLRRPRGGSDRGTDAAPIATVVAISPPVTAAMPSDTRRARRRAESRARSRPIQGILLEKDEGGLDALSRLLPTSTSATDQSTWSLYRGTDGARTRRSYHRAPTACLSRNARVGRCRPRQVGQRRRRPSIHPRSTTRESRLNGVRVTYARARTTLSAEEAHSRLTIRTWIRPTPEELIVGVRWLSHECRPQRHAVLNGVAWAS